MKLTKKDLPNMMTMVRFVGTFAIIFLDLFGLPFYVVYTLSGLSDVLDGYFARKFDAKSKQGAILDTVADLLFYSVLIIKLFPYLWIYASKKIWVCGFGVVFLRIISYSVAALKYKCFTSLHTYGNKLTGAMVFSLPYTLFLFDETRTCIAVCVVAAIATTEELVLHIRSKEYDPNRKTLFKLCK